MPDKPREMRLPDSPPPYSGITDRESADTMPYGSMETAMPEESSEGVEPSTGGMPLGSMNAPPATMSEMPTGAMVTEMAGDEMRPLEAGEYGMPGSGASMPAGLMTDGGKNLESQNFEISGQFRLTLFPGSLNVR